MNFEPIMHPIIALPKQMDLVPYVRWNPLRIDDKLRANWDRFSALLIESNFLLYFVGQFLAFFLHRDSIIAIFYLPIRVFLAFLSKVLVSIKKVLHSPYLVSLDLLMFR